MSWRYQPVFTKNKVGDESSYFLVEVYFKGVSNKLQMWENIDERMQQAPVGCDHDDLIGDLRHMLADAERWEPVEYCKLKSGMRFTERKIKEPTP